MICQFTFKGQNIYIRTDSIVAILPEVKGNKAVVYTEPPLEAITVDETVDEAFTEWYFRLMESIHGEVEPPMSWSDAAIEV
tara:strand:- start:541 stop:783 length:243 start_codon:yes stop_codon:yes gene_type:complete